MTELVYAGLTALGISGVFFNKKKPGYNQEQTELEKELNEKFKRRKEEELFSEYLAHKEVKDQLDRDISFLKKKIHEIDIVNIQINDVEELRALLQISKRISDRIKILEAYKGIKLNPLREMALMYDALFRFDPNDPKACLPRSIDRWQRYIDNSYSKARELLEKKIVQKEKAAIDLELGGKK